MSVAPHRRRTAGLVLTALVVFWTARRVRAGLGAANRCYVAFAGLVASLIAIVSTPGDPSLIYGRWPALDPRANRLVHS
jgi:hypothetical protein